MNGAFQLSRLIACPFPLVNLAASNQNLVSNLKINILL